MEERNSRWHFHARQHGRPIVHDRSAPTWHANGMLYLSTTAGLYCLRDSKPESSNETMTLAASTGATFSPNCEATVEDDAAIAWLQIIPAEATLAGNVTAPFPWAFDFSDQQVPVTWIGARYRHEARVVDGDPAIVKITTIPKGTRSQTWMGSPDACDYTITVDVKAAASGDKLPDMGVINQRYTMDLMGEAQQLQIRTWTAQLRMARSVSFAWQAGQWYRLKFTASVENNQAILKGKVWPHDEAESTQWTLTATEDA